MTIGLILASDGSYGGIGTYTGVGNIFTIRPDGTGKTYLTADGPDCSDLLASWSYDGSEIVYTRETPDDLPRLWIMAADGSGKHQLTFGALSVQSATFSPDGSSILFTGFTTDHPELWVMNVDGTNPHQITNTTGREVTFQGEILQWSFAGSYSPDGTKIVYASTQSSNSEIWVMNADGSDPVQLTFAQDPNYPDANAPSWSPDGSKIAFFSGFAHGHGNIFTINPDGTGRTQLTSTPAPQNSDNPIWAADGKAILFDTNRSGTPETWVMDADGNDQHMLFPGGYATSRLPVVSRLPVASSLVETFESPIGTDNPYDTTVSSGNSLDPNFTSLDLPASWGTKSALVTIGPDQGAAFWMKRDGAENPNGYRFSGSFMVETDGMVDGTGGNGLAGAIGGTDITLFISKSADWSGPLAAWRLYIAQENGQLELALVLGVNTDAKTLSGTVYKVPMNLHQAYDVSIVYDTAHRFYSWSIDGQLKAVGNMPTDWPSIGTEIIGSSGSSTGRNSSYVVDNVSWTELNTGDHDLVETFESPNGTDNNYDGSTNETGRK